MAVGGVQQDISFTVGSTTYGYKLLRDDKGWPIYKRNLASYLGNSTPSGRVTVDNTNPDKLMIREQASFVGGFGQNDFDDATKYYDTTNCEATVAGRVYLSADDTAESNIVPSITNGGFESALGAEWTATGARTTSYPNEGSAELTCDAGEEAYQDISWLAAYQSKTVVVTAAGMVTVDGGTATLTVDDGVGTSTDTVTWPTPGNGTIANSTGGTIGYGSVTDGTGTCTGSPVNLASGNNDIGVTGLGTLTIHLNAGCTGTATSDVGTVSGSPVALTAGTNTITTTTGNIVVNVAGAPTGVISHGTSTKVHFSDGVGAFTVTLPAGCKGTATSGTCTLTGSPVSLSEGVTTISGATAVGDITIVFYQWQGLCVSRALNAAATRLRIKVSATDQQCLFDSVKIAYPTRFAVFGTTLYQARGARLESWSGSAWTEVAVFNHEITDLAVMSSYLFIALGSGYAYYYTSDGTTYTGRANYTTTNVKYPQLFTVVGSTLYTWYSTSDSIYSATEANAALGNWTAVASSAFPGQAAIDITKMPDSFDTLYIVKQDSIWELDTGAWVQIADLKGDYGTNTGKNALIWHGDMYVPTNGATLYRIEGIATVTDITPANYGTISTYRYRTAAIVGDGRYLTTIMTDGTDAYILRGEENDSGKWVWHPSGKVTGLTDIYDAIIFSDSGVLKLFIAAEPGSCWLYHPTDYGSHAGYGSNYEVASGTLTTSWHYGNFRNENKAFYSLTFSAGGLAYSAGTDERTIKVEYALDGSASWTELGTTATATALQTFNFAAGTKGKSIRFRFTPARSGASATAGPYLEWYAWEGQLLPTDRKFVWDIGLDLSSSVTTLNGVVASSSPKAAFAALKTAINNGAPVTFTDVYNDTYYVTVADIDDRLGKENLGKHDHRVILQLQEAKWTAP